MTTTTTDSTLMNLKTKSGKAIQDFEIPEALLQDVELLTLVFNTGSMEDEDRQYWFNLYEFMESEQIEKLRGILIKEKRKIDEINAKYEKLNEDPEVAKARAIKEGEDRLVQQQALKQKHVETFDEDSILSELDNL